MPIQLPVDIGPYTLEGEIASGGMATVYFGRKHGINAPSVAIKRMHPHCASDPNFIAMFLDEANLSSRISHPNVVSILDSVSTGNDLLIVMEFVAGDTVARLMASAVKLKYRPNYRVVASVIVDVLDGLHAAHNAVGINGQPLNIVHRDISPQNVMVGVDGSARVLDFGVAKAVGRMQTTRAGQFKGRLQYMAPEHIRARPVDRRSDIYAVSVLMWEMLAGRQLFSGDNLGSTMAKVLEGMVPSLRAVAPDVPPAVEALILKGLRADPADRFQTAQQMANAVREAVGHLSTPMVAEWVARVIPAKTLQLIQRIQRIQTGVQAPSFTFQDPLASSNDHPSALLSTQMPLPSAYGHDPVVGKAGLPFSQAAISSLAPQAANPHLASSSVATAIHANAASANLQLREAAQQQRKKRRHLALLASAYSLAFALFLGAFWFALHRVSWLGPTILQIVRVVAGNNVTSKIEITAISVDARAKQWLGLGSSSKAAHIFRNSSDVATAVTILKPMAYPTALAPMIIAPFARNDGDWIAAHLVPEGSEPYMYKTSIHVDSSNEQQVVRLLLIDTPRCGIVHGKPDPTDPVQGSHPTIAVVDVPAVTSTAVTAAFRNSSVPCTVGFSPSSDDPNATHTITGTFHIKPEINPKPVFLWSIPSVACLLQSGAEASRLDRTVRSRLMAIGTRPKDKAIMIGIGENTDQSGLQRVLRYAGISDAAQLGGFGLDAQISIANLTSSNTPDSLPKALFPVSSSVQSSPKPQADKIVQQAIQLTILAKPLK